MKKIALLFILVFLPMLACADAVEIDGIYYTLVPDSKVAEVTSDPNKYTGDITIPTTIEYDGEVYDVTAIGDNAFYDCKNITSVTIGNSVESIGHYAFAGCGRLASLTIPNSVGTIGNSAFSLCNGLRSLNIGNSVTSIGRSTFNGCSSLSSVIIPNGVTSIGDYAFQQCIGMASVTIPNSVTSIGNAAFLGCGLTSVTIPNSVKSIGDAAFQNCQRVTSIIVEDGNPVYDSRNNSNAIIETASNRLIAGCNNTTIPNGVTSIGNYAFQKCLFLTSVIIPSSVTSIGDGAFRDCRAVREIVNKAQTPPVCGIQPFYGINISECKLYVPASSVSAYQAVEPWKNFKEIVALPAQGGETDDSDYIPFVELGKVWHVVYSDNPTCPSVFLTYYMYKEEERDGKTYILIHRSIDEQQTSQPVGLFREENRRVYEYDEATGREYMLYDFTLKESDTFTYEPEPDYSLKCKVLKQGWLDDGPQIASSFTLTSADTIDIKYRRLRTWTIGCENKSGEYREIATWVEGVGTLENMFCSLNSVGQNCLAYIERKDNETSYHKNDYLPFSFYNMFGQVYGCELPIGAENNEEDDEHHKLTYELEGDRLHVYGEVFCNCGPNHYAYFCEKPTDDPSVHKIEFITQDVEPLMWCVGLHATGFYVSGFDPNLNYIVVDNQGVEHPVIKKVQQTDYRPLVVEGKHWTYDNYMPLRPAEYDHYYYYNLRGDTLISGKKCLKMYSENRANDGIVRYEGALYEESKKVYCFFPGKDEAELLYDFDCKVGDTLQIYYPYNYQVLVKDIQTEDNGGIDVKKYTLKIIWDYEEEYVVWIEGVGAMLDFFGMVPAAGNYNSLNACELNGEKLYQYIEPDLTAKGYHKMGIEGKRWNYIHYYVDEDGEHRDPYSYVVKGDTVIRRTTYKKLWYQDEKTERLVCLLYESGRTISKTYELGNNSNGEVYLSAFFWFDRDDFGRVFSWKSNVNSGNTNWMPYGVDTIEVKGQPFRRYTCLQKYSEEGETLTTIAYDGEGVWHDIWVEGVGSASSGIEDQIPFHEPPVRTPGEYTYFVSCYENGECIFTAEDFNIQAKPVTDMAYRPFVEDDKVWKIGAEGSGNPVQWVEYYYFDGDTIIDGKACKKMMCERYINLDYAESNFISQENSLSYVGVWYEEDKKVYFYDTTNKQFKLMYDFSIEDNGTFQTNGLSYVIGSRQTGGIKGFKGVHRDVREYGDGENTFRCAPWLEGVGGVYGPPTTNVFNVELADPMWFLMSCTVGDEVIYFNDGYEDGATPEEVNARKQRIDFTHTIKIRPKARKEEAEPSLYGEYNALQLGINLNPLDNAYLVCISDETGKTVYEKTVNAANIVGLNIDISAYAEGRYTVTVENDNESFTGVIDTRTTGISLTPTLSKREGAIYNLQGQRISSLRKGLNIVSGRKIFVK